MARFPLDEDAIRKLASLLDETGLGEIEYGDGERTIRVSRGGSAAAPAYAAVVPAAASAGAVAAPSADDARHPGAVPSPMVGTVYLSPEPGAPAFVKAGDTVSEGQTLLIVEAMKTFNPIRSPRAGKIVKVLVSDGQPVEFGEALVIVS